MTKSILLEKIVSKLAYLPTEDQFNMLNKLIDFLFLKNETSLFLLKGYAGTGKSSLTGGVVQTLRELNQKVVLLAPTGRAARVFARYAGMEAQTIHRKIYRQKTYSSENFEFTTNRNVHKDTLFIVDEASMIANQSVEGSCYSQGGLLDDLMEFVYSSENCRLILIGDTAQLPPIGQTISQAMDKSFLEGYGMDVSEYVLMKVVRQAEESGILWNATLLRNRIAGEDVNELPRMDLKGFKDIKGITGEDFLDLLNDSYRNAGEEEVLIITRSNKRANLYNNGVRARVLYREDEISSGDLLLIAKNNYALAEEYPELNFIANGETAEIQRVRRRQDMYGFRFAEVTLRLIDRDMTIDAKVNIDTLHSDSAALTYDQMSKLFYAVAEDYRYDYPENVALRKIKKDPYYNALQVKYAYCMTCHKAQGGQWRHIYIDLGNLNPEHMGMDFYRWLYTAMTRATEKVYLVNMPDEMYG